MIHAAKQGKLKKKFHKRVHKEGESESVFVSNSSRVSGVISNVKKRITVYTQRKNRQRNTKAYIHM